jgi:hypothetical protein
LSLQARHSFRTGHLHLPSSCDKCHAEGHDKRDGLFMHMVDGWMYRSVGYCDWADKGLDLAEEMSLEMDEPFLVL